MDGLRSRSITENHLRELFEETGDGPEKKVEDFAALRLSPDAPATAALPTAGDEALKEHNAQKKGKLDRIFDPLEANLAALEA